MPHCHSERHNLFLCTEDKHYRVTMSAKQLPSATLPQWFVGIFGIVYLAGYLIDTYYFSLLGLSDSTGELIKLKYVQTGIGFVLLFAICTTPIFLFLMQPGATPSHRRARKLARFATASVWHVAMNIVFGFSIYLSVLFTPPDYFVEQDRRWAIAISILAIVAGYLGATEIVDRKNKAIRDEDSKIQALIADQKLSKTEEDNWAAKMKDWNAKVEQYRLNIPVTVTFIILACDVLIFDGVGASIFEMLRSYGFYFLLLCLLGQAMVMRTWVRIPLFYDSVIQTTGYIFVMSVITVVILYTAVLSYAYGVYPYIPAAKGGGDFSFSPRLSINLKPEAAEATAPSPIENVVSIYSTQASIYVARPTKGSDACDWKTHRSRPTLTEIPRERIRTLTSRSLNLKQQESNCL